MSDFILTRRSIRKFKNQSISEDLVKYFLEAAMAAPSATNQQPWQFIVLTDRKLLDQIPTIHPYTKMILETPLAIIVCGDLEKEKAKGFWVQDCSAATQNILLAVHSKGLGAVWCGVYPREDKVKAIQELLKLPETIIPLSIIPIGYPNEEKEPSQRYDKNNVHYNGW